MGYVEKVLPRKLGVHQEKKETTLFIGTEIVNVTRQQFPLPQRFIAEGGNDWVLTLGFEQNLSLVPAPVFTVLEHSMRSLNILNPSARLLQRLLLGSAKSLTLDANGNLTLPEALTNAVDMGSEIVLVGQGAFIEIWTNEAWNTQIEVLSAGQTTFDPTISITFEGK